ncbi:MAG: glycosyltransferase [Vicinamibacterales bacterium]
MSALRILHVVPYYEHAWAYGGIPRLATTMTRGLAARGHRVTVCTTDVCDSRSRLSVTTTRSAIDVRMFRNVSNRLAYNYQFFTPVGLNRFLRAHARTFDVAHLHACRNLPGEIAARALKTSSVPYLVSPNGTAPAIERRLIAKQMFDLVAGQQMLQGAARILATSNAERNQLLALGLPAEKIRVLPNPIDESEYQHRFEEDRFRRTYGLGSQPIVLFLGKLTPRKGVDVLLRAFHSIAGPPQLVIAGNDMGAGARVHQLIAELNLDHRVTRTGLLQGAERLDALAAATVVVYPSRDEVFGLVAVEALMCGSPVVVCNDSGCGEIIAEVGGGLRVPYGDAVQLAAAIRSVLDSPDPWRVRAQAASGLVRERFGSTHVCAQLEALYQEVLLESSPRSGAA